MRALGLLARMLAGRWEIPLALCAVGATSLALYRLTQEARRAPGGAEFHFDAVLADIKTLADGGALLEATDAAAGLLAAQPPLSPHEQALLHDFLAGAIHRMESARVEPDPVNAGLILTHVEKAASLGLPPTLERELQCAQACEWGGRLQQAIEAYEHVLVRVGETTTLPSQPSQDAARAAHMALVRLLTGQPDREAQRRRSLVALLEDPGLPAAGLWWTLRTAVRDALDVNDTVKARELLTRYGEPLKRSDLRGYHDYLWAWVYLAEGRVAEAGPLARWVDTWLSTVEGAATGADETGLPGEVEGDGRSALGAANGQLPAMNRWLLGEILLAEGRPAEALESFDAALRLPGARELHAAAVVGRGRALLQLERDVDAVAGFREAADRLAARRGDGAAPGGTGATAADASSDNAVRTLLARLDHALRGDDAGHAQADPGRRAPSEAPPEPPADRAARRGIGPSSAALLRRLTDGLLALAETRRSQRRFADAVEYLTLALEVAPRGAPAERLRIVELLADDCASAAGALRAGRVDGHDAAAAGIYDAAAGRLYVEASELVEFDEPRVAGLIWSAAEAFDRAGRTQDVRRTLLRFVEGRSYHPNYPAGLLRLGATYEAEGRYADALPWYERLADGFPRLPEAARARVLMAGCLVALGEAHYPRAEALLGGLLEDDDVSPQSLVFRDALYALSELLYYQGRNSEAISRLEDLLRWYPDDPERFRSRFMLADAYRKSGLGLRNSGGDAPDETAEPVARERLRRAAVLFDELVRQIEREPRLDESLRLYERLGLLYRGDCLMELNDAESLREARAVYQQAAARYAREPAALMAHVQLARIDLREGRVTEAARATEQARWLLDSIPDEAFVAYDDGTDRAAWREYLETLSRAHLFQNVFTSTR